MTCILRSVTYPREYFSCTRAASLFRPATGIYARNLYLYPRGDAIPAGHGYIRGKSSPVPARRRFPGRSRVYTWEIFTCTRAASLFRPAAGISAGNLLLYPRAVAFPAGRGYIRGKSSPVPARRHFSGRPRVYTRKIFTCTRGNLPFHPGGSQAPLPFHPFCRFRTRQRQFYQLFLHAGAHMNCQYHMK